MAMITVSGYQEANETLRLSDLRQALYDEGAILMEKVLVNLHGQEHRNRRQIEAKPSVTRKPFGQKSVRPSRNLIASSFSRRCKGVAS